MIRSGRLMIGILAVTGLLACAAQAPTNSASGSSENPVGQVVAPRISRTLIMAGRSEAPTVASRPFRNFGLASGVVGRLFNAGFSLRDGAGNFRPYLAE